jgi:hypothetical protein
MINTCQLSNLKVKVNNRFTGLDRPKVFREVEAPRFKTIDKFAIPMQQPNLPLEIFLVLIPLRGKIDNKMFKMHTKLKLRVFIEFYSRYLGIILNKPQTKINLSWDKLNFGTLSTDVKLLKGSRILLNFRR